jgi:hypothetical protein
MKRLRSLLILTLLLPATVLVSSASYAGSKLEATIFSYDGKNFVRNQTTLTEEGQTAAGTKLGHDSAAYKALVQKHSHTGNYAPLIGKDGQLTGAVFVGVPK